MFQNQLFIFLIFVNFRETPVMPMLSSNFLFTVVLGTVLTHFYVKLLLLSPWLLSLTSNIHQCAIQLQNSVITWILSSIFSSVVFVFASQSTRNIQGYITKYRILSSKTCLTNNIPGIILQNLRTLKDDIWQDQIAITGMSIYFQWYLKSCD